MSDESAKTPATEGSDSPDAWPGGGEPERVSGEKATTIRIEPAPTTTGGRRIHASSLTSGRRYKAADFAESTAELGRSAQIPAEILDRLQNNIIEPPLGARSFEELSALLLESTDFSCVVSQLATDVVGTGYQLVADKPDQEPDPAELEKARALLDNENSEITLEEILHAAWSDFESIGNAWIEVIRAGNKPDAPPVGFAHAPGMTMRLHRNLQGFVQLSLDERRVTYFRKLFSDPVAPTSKYPPGHENQGEVMNEMIFLRDYNPASPWYGVPRVVPAINAIKGSLYSSQRNIAFFQNRAMPEWAIVVSGETDGIAEKDLIKFKEEIEEYFRNVLLGQDYRTLYIEVPKGVLVEFKKIGGDVTDADFRNYRIDNRDEILRAYQMMPNRVGIIETGNIGAGTGESQIEIYNISVVRPRRTKLERPFNQILRRDPPQGLGLKTVRFRFNPIDTVDEQRETDIARVLGDLGWMSINEGRSYVSRFLRVDLKPIEDEWADLPLPILLAILSGGAAAEVGLPAATDPVGTSAGLSPLGVALPPTKARLVQDLGQALVGPISDAARRSIDRAYSRAADRRGTNGPTSAA